MLILKMKYIIYLLTDCNGKTALYCVLFFVMRWYFLHNLHIRWKFGNYFVSLKNIFRLLIRFSIYKYVCICMCINDILIKRMGSQFSKYDCHLVKMCAMFFLLYHNQNWDKRRKTNVLIRFTQEKWTSCFMKNSKFQMNNKKSNNVFHIFRHRNGKPI